MLSGFVPVVGRPNVGKSTLVNALVGSKVSITSKRPQTTRNTIRGVLTRDEFQIVFVDTPGLHKPRTALGGRLNELVRGSLADADVVLFVIDASAPVGPGDRRIAASLIEADTPVVVAINKTDAASPAEIASQLTVAAEWDLAAYVPVSALDGDVPGIVDELVSRLPEGPAYFPPDAVTDQPDQFLAGEIIREKFLDRLRDELPHSLAVVVGDMEQRKNGMLYIPATLYVERTSQKGIVIGKGAELLRQAGGDAREELRVLFGTEIYVDLTVKVEKDWQRRNATLDRFGF
ncbi:MAG: GTPase Era [Acidimicrobiia bacterium]|nr:GTPase Era [Acidimicrobiia bacterium]NNC74969.1 GTPase Era [Acidimicrobiia bacterium]